MQYGPSTFRFVLAARDRLIRETLAARLSAAGFEGSHVAGNLHDIRWDTFAGTGILLIVHLSEDEPDVCDLLRDAKAANPELRIVIIGRQLSPVTIAACLEIGVSTILDQDVSFDRFLNYLRFTALDERAIPSDLAGIALHSLRPYLHAPEVRVELTRREKMVLAHLVEGSSNKQIARHLGIAHTTVKVNVKTILRKLNASNRTQAAVWALNHNIRGSLLRDGVERNGASPGDAVGHAGSGIANCEKGETAPRHDDREARGVTT